MPQAVVELFKPSNSLPKVGQRLERTKTQIEKINSGLTLPRLPKMKNNLPKLMQYGGDSNINYARAILLSDNRHPISEMFPYYIFPIKFENKEVKNIFSIPSIYVDWGKFNPNPYNIFRSFNFKGFALKKFLNMDNNEAIEYLLKHGPRGKDAGFNELNMNQIPYWAHPLEYNTISAREYVNGYNLLEMCNAENPDCWQISHLRQIYLGLFDQIKLDHRQINRNKYEFKTTNSTNRMGTYVNHDVLNQARARGCLFIRKCEDGCMIQKFANQLYDRNSEYLYK